LPEDLSEEHVEEITAEELVDGKWVKRRARNETWDHLVYGEAAILKPGFAQSRSDMRWIPQGFSVIWPNRSDYADQIAAPAAPPAAQNEVQAEEQSPAIKQQAKPRARRNRWVQRGGPWLKPR
jgi:phage terminase large subunit GpA-like protein